MLLVFFCYYCVACAHRRYLILAANLCWVVTTAPPLRPARTALFVLVALGLLLERYLCEDELGGTVLVRVLRLLVA